MRAIVYDGVKENGKITKNFAYIGIPSGKMPEGGYPYFVEYAGYKMSQSRIKRLNAVMQTCGFYDEAGEFSYLVGLPGKSGVGGGIVAVCPMRYAVAVWSPRLNSKGNSVLGMKALELLTTETQESIF